MIENTRDLLAKSEKQINEARRKRESEQCAADREQREALEKQSPSGARRSLVDILNAGSVAGTPIEGGIEQLLTKLRADQKSWPPHAAGAQPHLCAARKGYRNGRV